MKIYSSLHLFMSNHALEHDLLHLNKFGKGMPFCRTCWRIWKIAFVSRLIGDKLLKERFDPGAAKSFLSEHLIFVGLGHPGKQKDRAKVALVSCILFARIVEKFTVFRHVFKGRQFP